MWNTAMRIVIASQNSSDSYLLPSKLVGKSKLAGNAPIT